MGPIAPSPYSIYIGLLSLSEKSLSFRDRNTVYGRPTLATVGLFVLVITMYTVRSLLQIFDTAITMGSFVLDLVFIEQMSSTKGEETIALLVIFLLWRVLRLVNGRSKPLNICRVRNWTELSLTGTVWASKACPLVIVDLYVRVYRYSRRPQLISEDQMFEANFQLFTIFFWILSLGRAGSSMRLVRPKPQDSGPGPNRNP